ncbi:MAG: hypothetical protein ACYTGL_15640 [Planctomycetota bacterium]|jgi:hypothetical protein
MSITRRFLLNSLTAFGLIIAGCSDGAAPDESVATTEETVSEAPVVDESNSETKTPDAADDAPTFYKPITLGGANPAETAGDDTGATSTSKPAGPPPTPDEIMAGLKPIATVLVGEWTGILKNASVNEAHSWYWDVKSDPANPAIVLQIPEGQFFTEARISYAPRTSQFTMATTDTEQTVRNYLGEFEEPPRDIPSDDGKSVERTFKLAFAEQVDEGTNEKFRYVISQQNNNRYLMEVHRARGKAAFRLRDVAGTQRNGVSFARADDDYGDRTCVISGGLGTTAVTHKGKTYYVCCSGCKAAFEDDPETWIARFEAKKNETN